MHISCSMCRLCLVSGKKKNYLKFRKKKREEFCLQNYHGLNGCQKNMDLLFQSNELKDYNLRCFIWGFGIHALKLTQSSFTIIFHCSFLAEYFVERGSIEITELKLLIFRICTCLPINIF